MHNFEKCGYNCSEMYSSVTWNGIFHLLFPRLEEGPKGPSYKGSEIVTNGSEIVSDALKQPFQLIKLCTYMEIKSRNYVKLGWWASVITPMANKSSFQMVSEGRGERRVKRKHGNNVLQMRSISCPGESGYFSESLENHGIHVNNQYIKTDRSRTERTDSDDGRRSRSFSSNSTCKNLSPETNSSLSVYTDARYDEISSFQKRKHSRHVSEDISKRNGHVNERSSSELTRPRHSRNARRKRSRNEDCGVEKYDSYCGNSLDGNQPRKEHSSSKTVDEQGRTNGRHRSGKSHRSTSNGSSELVPGDSRKRAPRHSRSSGKSSRNDTATSYDIPGMDPYPFNGYLKSSSKTDTRHCRWFSRRRVFMCLGCMFFTFVVALVVVGYLTGYFGKQTHTVNMC